MSARTLRSQRIASSRAWLIGLALTCSWAHRANAQASDIPAGAVRLGPLVAQPRVSLANLGIDSNVFNEATQPKSDQTFTVAPSVDLQMRVGRARLRGTSSLSYLYFNRYARERSLNGAQDGWLEFPLNRLTLRSSFAVASTRQRPGLEIDLRVRQLLSTLGIGADFRLASKTSLRFDALRSTTTFRGGVIDAVSLPTALSRSNDTLALSARYAVTTLTTLTLTAESVDDRFAVGASRNATGFRLMPGVEFSRFARISGGAAVGLRQFRPSSPIASPYSGVAARVALATVVRGALRISGLVDRDVGFSYNLTRPYYLQTSASVTGTQRLGRRWDVAVTAGLQQLTYLPLGTSSSTPITNADDLRGRNLTLSLGYYLARRVRVSADIRDGRRTSSLPERSYDGRQAGITVAYGF